MKTYRNAELGIEMDVPEAWSLPPFGASHTPFGESIVFGCNYFEAFNLQIGPLDPEPSPEQTENEFRRYIQNNNYSSLGLGRIRVEGKEHVWGRYYLAGGKWSKKYRVILSGIEYAMTATCYYQKMLLEREQVWDTVVTSFHQRAATASKNLQNEEVEQPVHPIQQLLKVYPRPSYPEKWAVIQCILASSYIKDPPTDRAASIEQAIAHYQQALEVFTRQNFPDKWALVQNDLGEAYRKRVCGERAENIDQAIFHYKQALEVQINQSNREQWAGTQNNLAAAYWDRPGGERAENLEHVILGSQQALQVYTREAYPEDWGMNHHRLGAAYQVRMRGDPAENIEQVIGHLQQALEVFTRQITPEKWAVTHNSLASAYVNRAHGDREENLDLAVHHCQQALEVYTQQAYPSRWGLCQIFLGIVLLYRKQGERSRNVDQAIQHYQQALEVFNREDYPEEWAKIQAGLAAAYQERDRSEKNLTARPVDISSKITYPQFYEEESQQQPGKKCNLKLIHSIVLDSPYLTSLNLVYQWDENLPDKEARSLALRAIAFVVCAIYDAAIQAGLFCQPSEIPNGRRPAWVLEGEQSPVSLTLSDIDISEKTCQMTIGAVVMFAGNPSGGRMHWDKLHAEFKARFSEITA